MKKGRHLQAGTSHERMCMQLRSEITYRHERQPREARKESYISQPATCTEATVEWRECDHVLWWSGLGGLGALASASPE